MASDAQDADANPGSTNATDDAGTHGELATEPDPRPEVDGSHERDRAPVRPPVTIRATLSSTGRLYLRHWLRFTGLVLATGLVFLVSMEALVTVLRAVSGHARSVVASGGELSLQGALFLIGAATLPVVVLIAVVLTAGIAAVADLTSAIIDGRRPSIWGGLRRGTRRAPAVIGAGIIAGAAVSASFMLAPLLSILGLVGLLLTPVAKLLQRRWPRLPRPSLRALVLMAVPFGVAVWCSLRWSLFIPAAMLERRGPRKALARSAELVRGRWVTVAVVTVLATVVSLLGQLVPGFVGYLISTDSTWLPTVIGGIGQIIFASLPLVAMTVLFLTALGDDGLDVVPDRVARTAAVRRNPILRGTTATLAALLIMSTLAIPMFVYAPAAAAAPLAPTITITSSNNPAPPGEDVTFTVTAAGESGVPTGSISLDDGSTHLADLTLDGAGTATFTTAALTRGIHPIVATYGGDATYAGNTSDAFEQGVRGPSTVTATSSLNPSVFGQPVTFTITVAQASGQPVPTGRINIEAPGGGSFELDGTGKTTWSPTLQAHPHFLYFSYTGDLVYAPSSTTLNQQVSKASTATALVLTAPATPGSADPVTLTATVSSPGSETAPTGEVTFLDDTTELGTATIGENGVATFTTPTLALGSHSFTAAFAGSGNVTGSTSTAVTYAVSGGASATVAVSASANPTGYRSPVTLAVHVDVASGSPSGTVELFDGPDQLGSVPVDGSGDASFTTTALAVGDHQITARYGSISSPAITQTITARPDAHFVVDDLGDAGDATPDDDACATSSGTCTLRAALDEANADNNRAYTVTFSVDGTITPATTLSMTSSVVIDGAGHRITLDGARNVQIMYAWVIGGTGRAVGVHNLMFTRGMSSNEAGALVLGATGATVTNVTFYDNDGANSGGALLTSGSTTITNTTFSENRASYSYGGADLMNVGVATVINTTFFEGNGGSIANIGGGSISMFNSIVKSTTGWACQGTITGTNNIANDSSCPATLVTQQYLGFYGDHGGSFPTVPLNPISPAIDAGRADLCPAADQRGIARPQLTACDLGATEFTPATTTTVASSNNPANFGEGILFTAQVTTVEGGYGPGGTVEIYDGSTLVGSGTVDGNGMVQVPTASLAVGSHSITATFVSSSIFTTSTSTPLTQVVVATTANVALTPPANPSAPGAPVTIGTHVTGNGSTQPTGSVTFLDGTTSLGTFTLDGDGRASVTTAALAIGPHTLTVRYEGDSQYTVTTSNPSAHSVLGSSSLRIVSQSPATIYGNAASITVAVDHPDAGPAPSGYVVCAWTGGSVSALLDASGQATCTTPDLAPGTTTGTLLYGGDAHYARSTDVPFTHDVTAAATIVGLSAVPSGTSTFGATVTFTATVTPQSSPANPVGTVELREGSTVVATGGVDGNGVATIYVSNLAVGSHSLAAVFVPGVGFAGSTSSAVTHAVGIAPTQSALVSSKSPTVTGEAVTLTATVTAPGSTAVPAGPVTFLDGTVVLGTATLDGTGSASLTTTELAVGSHTLTARFAATPDFATSTSGAISQVVDAAATTTSASASPTLAGYGAARTVTASVAPIAPGAGTPSGTITFSEGSTVLTTETLAGGSASFTTSTLAVGTHTITVTYTGDGSYATSTTDVTLEVANTTTTTAVSFSAEPSPFGTGTVTATITTSTGAVATGSVLFLDETTGGQYIGTIGTVPVDGTGKATATMTSVAVGDHRIGAYYNPDTNFVGSYKEVTHTVVPASTSTSLSATPATADVMTLVELRATVTSPGSPVAITGTVSFRDGGGLLASVPVDANGQASYSTYLSAGPHGLTARYDSDARYSWSLSPQIDRVVTTATPPMTFTATPSTADFGQTVDLEAAFTGTGIVPQGRVSFTEGSTLIGQASVDGTGEAHLLVSSLAVGTHTITASYEGDTNFVATSAGPTTVTVNPGSTTTTITSQQSTIFPASSNTFTAHVDSNGSPAVPTGSIAFKLDGTTLLATVAVDGSGNAQYATSSLPKGSHTITAEYAASPGVSTFGPSSGSVGVTVTPLESRVTITAPGGYTGVWGQPTTFNVSVSSGGVLGGPAPAITGTIEVSDLNGHTCTVVAPQGSCSILLPTPGTVTVAANYLGDARWDPTASITYYTVQPRTPTVTQSMSPEQPVGGEPVTITWSVSGDGVLPGPTAGSTIVWACGTTAQPMNGSCTFTPPVNQKASVNQQVTFLSSTVGWASKSTPAGSTPVLPCWRTTFSSNSTTLPVQVSPAPNCGGVGYIDGTPVTLTAAPASGGLVFKNWNPSGDTSSTMTHWVYEWSRYQTANYANPCVDVTVSTYGGSGSVSVGTPDGWSVNSNCGTYQTSYSRSGNATYHLRAGTPLKLVAKPGSDGGRANSFVGWTGDVTGTDPTVSFVVPTSDAWVTAMFHNPPPPCWRPSFLSRGDGHLVKASPAPTCNNGQGAGYRAGDTVTYVVERTNNAYFDHWVGGVTTVTDGSAGTLPKTQTAGRITFPGSTNPNPTIDLGAVFSTCRQVQTRLDYYSSGPYAPTTVNQTAGNCPNRPGEAGWYTPGTRVDLTVGTIYYGFKIDKWDGATPWSANWLDRATTTADTDKTVVLYLYSDWGCRALDVQSVPAGAADVKVIAQPSNCPAGRYPHYDEFGDRVSFSAKPTQGDPFIGWTVDTGQIYDRGGSTRPVHQVVQGRDLTTTLVGASTVKAYACQKVGINFVLVGPTGVEHPGDARGTDFIGADKDPNCEPGTVGNGLAWTVGSTVVFGAGAPEQAYKFVGWSGDVSGTDANQAVLFDGKKQSISLTAKYQAICYQLKGQNLDHAEISPKPNCPDKDPGERWYLGGTSVVLHATPWSGTAFTGWTGDAERGGDPTFVTMTSNKTVNATYRNLDWDEKAAQWIEGAANTFVNEAGVFSKKLVGVLAVVTTAVVNDAVPFGFVNGVVAIGQGIDSVLKMMGVSGGIGPAMGDALQYVQETMTMLNASLTCAADWAAGGSTQQRQQQQADPAQAFDSGAEVADKAVELAKQTDNAAAALRDAERLKTAAEVAVRNGEKEGASMLAKAEAAYLTKKLEYTTLKNKYASQTKVAKKLGLAVAIGQGIYDNVASGPGVVWEDNASDAWTSGGDAFMACTARQMPSYMGVPPQAKQ